jgi:prophage maintenance system killer protein
MPDIIFLTVDQVIELHTLALTYGSGGIDGVRSHQQLAAAVMHPQQSAFGEDAYPTEPTCAYPVVSARHHM